MRAIPIVHPCLFLWPAFCVSYTKGFLKVGRTVLNLPMLCKSRRSCNTVQVPLPDEDARFQILYKKMHRLSQDLSEMRLREQNLHRGVWSRFANHLFAKRPLNTASPSSIPSVPAEWLDVEYVSCPSPWQPISAHMTSEQRSKWVCAPVHHI
jgi:hypothetical protein